MSLVPKSVGKKIVFRIQCTAIIIVTFMGLLTHISVTHSNHPNKGKLVVLPVKYEVENVQQNHTFAVICVKYGNVHMQTQRLAHRRGPYNE